MTALAVTFTNPRTSVRATLDSLLSETVGTAFPTATDVGTKAAPSTGYVQVAWDGTPGTDYPVTIHATIRVTCWHINPTPAEDLCLRIVGYLGGRAEGDAGLWTVRHLTGPLSGPDEDTGWWFAYATFRASPKPTAL